MGDRKRFRRDSEKRKFSMSYKVAFVQNINMSKIYFTVTYPTLQRFSVTAHAEKKFDIIDLRLRVSFHLYMKYKVGLLAGNNQLIHVPGLIKDRAIHQEIRQC